MKTQKTFQRDPTKKNFTKLTNRLGERNKLFTIVNNLILTYFYESKIFHYHINFRHFILGGGVLLTK